MKAHRWLNASLVIALSCGSGFASEWIELGPAPIINGGYTGRLSAVVASPTNPDKYYVAGADGGVWKTTNGGTSWRALTDDLPICSIGALALDPTNDDIIYAGSGEANYANHCVYGLGLYKSVDGGESWEVLAADTFAGRTFARIAVSHTNPQVVYAAVGHAGGFPARIAAKGHPLADGPVGLFKSTNGGHHWEQITSGVPTIAATDLVLDPVNDQRVFVAFGHIFGDTDNGIYRSINGGASFTKLSGGLPSSGVGRISLAIAPSDPNRLYTIYTRAADSIGNGASTLSVYRTDNGGDTWIDINPGNFQATYGWYLSTAIVRPTDKDTFFLGGLSLLRGVAGGSSYSNRTPPHVDMHGLAFDASGRLLVADDGGLHRSPDFGNTWESLNVGLGVIQFYAGLSVSPVARDFVLAGFQDNGTCIRSSGVEWVNKIGGDGGYTSLSPFDSNVMFAEFQGSGNLYRSINGGSTFSASGSGIDSSDRHCFLPPHAFDPEVPSRLLYATHRIYQSTNNGSTWQVLTGDLTGGPPAAIRAMAIAPSDRMTVYVATNDGRVLVSTDAGASFGLVMTDHPGWPRVTREIGIDPLDATIAFICSGFFGNDRIQMTTDRGTTWTTVDGDLPDVPVNAVAVFNDGQVRWVFAGTDQGLFASDNDGVTWERLGEGLPNSPVVDVVVDMTQGRLLAATQGRGLWQIPLPRIICAGVSHLKVKCKTGGKLVAKVSSSLVEGTVLTLANGAEPQKQVVLNRRGVGKAVWKQQVGERTVCVVECDLCATAGCP